LDVLGRLAASPNASLGPDGRPAQTLLDLAVLRIRGRLDLAPPTYSGPGVEYTVVEQTAPFEPLEPPLPPGVPLGDPQSLRIHEDVVSVFGWYSQSGELTLFAPEAKPIMSISAGMLMTTSLLVDGGSGGATCDHNGRLVAVNSQSLQATLQPNPEYKAYCRMLSELCDAHGLDHMPPALTATAASEPLGTVHDPVRLAELHNMLNIRFARPTMLRLRALLSPLHDRREPEAQTEMAPAAETTAVVGAEPSVRSSTANPEHQPRRTSFEESTQRHSVANLGEPLTPPRPSRPESSQVERGKSPRIYYAEPQGVSRAPGKYV